MSLQSLARRDLIFCPLQAADRQSVLRSFAASIAEVGAVDDGEELLRRLVEREELGSTGIGSGVAIPHCKMPSLDEPILAVGMVAGEGIDFAALDDQPVRIFFTVVSPEQEPAAHLKVLAQISRWVKVERNVETLLTCQAAERIYELLGEEG